MEIESGTPARGRPRAFDRAASLRKALHLFWAHGYEGTSVADLVAAMGITPPSLYAAFGSKEALYREAVRLYLTGPGRAAARALEEEPTARGAVQRILREAARSFRAGAHPPGCMVSTGVLACASEHQGVARDVAALRMQTIDAVARRFERAQAEGELPRSVNARDLARFYGSVIQGMSVQARDGASRSELAAIAEMALQAWPKRARQSAPGKTALRGGRAEARR